MVTTLNIPRNRKIKMIITFLHNGAWTSWGRTLKFIQLTNPKCTNIATALITAPITIKVKGSLKSARNNTTPKIIWAQRKI